MRNLRSRPIRSWVAGVALCVVGCSPGADPGHEPTALFHAPIINGETDTEHPAAVAITHGASEQANCSGTIVKVEGDEGWVLTAAHCAPGASSGVIALGHLDENPREFPILEVMANPAYDTTLHSWWNDYAVIRFAGADATVPFIPAAQAGEDGLATGDVVTLVGYGQTSGTGQLTSQRRTIDRPLSTLTPDTFQYDQATGGICFGDSGGPALAETANGLRVVGVTTAVSDMTCGGWGGSARVSSAYDAFIAPLLAKPSFDGCPACFGAGLQTAECSLLLDACFAAGSDCDAYNACSSGCSDLACSNACAASHPAGAAQYAEMLACPCPSCGDRCSGETLCGGDASGCGFVSDTPSCSDCIAGCCAEARACADDTSGCSSCFPSCSADAAADALSACLAASSCTSTCGLDLVVEINGSGGVGGGGDTGVSASAQASSGAGPSSTNGPGSATSAASAGGGGNGSGGTSSASTAPGKGQTQDDGGCAMAPGHDSRPGPWLLLFALVGFRRSFRGSGRP